MTTETQTSESIDEEMREMFEGNFLHSDDVMSSGPITLVISGVVAQNKEKDAAKRLINRPIVSFKGASKRLIVGKLNTSILGLLYGKKPSKWIGKSVTLVVTYLREAFGQKNVPTIRLATTDDKPLPFRLRAWYGSPVPYESDTRPRRASEKPASKDATSESQQTQASAQ